MSDSSSRVCLPLALSSSNKMVDSPHYIVIPRNFRQASEAVEVRASYGKGSGKVHFQPFCPIVHTKSSLHRYSEKIPRSFQGDRG